MSESVNRAIQFMKSYLNLFGNGSQSLEDLELDLALSSSGLVAGSGLVLGLGSQGSNSLSVRIGFK